MNSFSGPLSIVNNFISTTFDCTSFGADDNFSFYLNDFGVIAADFKTSGFNYFSFDIRLVYSSG